MPTSSFLVERGVTWLTAANAISALYNAATASRVHVSASAAYVECGTDPTYPILFNFPLPVQLVGLAVKITELLVYYYTAASPDTYITTIELRQVNPADGTTTATPLNYTTDLGNGSSGNSNASLLAAPLTLANAPHILCVWTAANNNYDQVRIFGFKVTWEATG